MSLPPNGYRPLYVHLYGPEAPLPDSLQEAARLSPAVFLFNDFGTSSLLSNEGALVLNVVIEAPAKPSSTVTIFWYGDIPDEYWVGTVEDAPPVVAERLYRVYRASHAAVPGSEVAASGRRRRPSAH